MYITSWVETAPVTQCLAFLSQLKGELSQFKGEIGNRTERTMPFEGQETVAVIVE